MTDLTPNIWQLQAKSDIPSLLEALEYPDPTIRRRAAAALRTLSAVSALEALEKRMALEQDTAVRATIASALEYLLVEQGPVRLSETRRLVEQLRSDDLPTAIKAAQELAVLKDKTAVEALVMIFHDSRVSSKLRLAAAEALVALESAPALVTLLVALNSSEWAIRRNAAAVLGQLRADWAIQPLIDHLQDSNEVVARTCRAALKRIGTPEALAAVTGDTGPLQSKIETSTLPATRPLQPRPTQASDETRPHPPKGWKKISPTD